MRIILHDYAGHAFAVALSRQLAQRGHRVTHLFAAYNRTPRGALHTSSLDPPLLTFQAIRVGRPLDKDHLFRRWMHEREYGRLLGQEILRIRPDLVISGNAPLDAQQEALKACETVGCAFVFWVQDLLGVGMNSILRRHIPVFGRLIGEYYMRKEFALLRRSDAVITISEGHRRSLEAMKIRTERLHTIPNWAVACEIPTLGKSNDWSRLHSLDGFFCFLYSGTLGRKHDPKPLAILAEHYLDRTDVRIVVISEGPKVDWLNKVARERGLRNLVTMPFQPYEEFAQVLASGDVLLGVLESDAGLFSVPSKVLSYLCAGRPILLSMPAGNQAARIVTSAEAGYVVDPADTPGFIRASETLVNQPALRSRMGRNARAYAERSFDLEAIADQFEAMIQCLPKANQ